MQVNAVPAAANTEPTNPLSSLQDPMDFINLLLEQLKNQDPLEPMDNKEFMNQMVQFGSLQQMVDLNDQITRLAVAQESTEAVSLVGREVAYRTDNDAPVWGIVEGVRWNDSGEAVLLIDGNEIRMEQVLEMSLTTDGQQ